MVVVVGRVGGRGQVPGKLRDGICRGRGVLVSVVCLEVKVSMVSSELACPVEFHDLGVREHGIPSSIHTEVQHQASVIQQTKIPGP